MHRDVKTIVVSGGIGSGKSFVCSVLAGRGLDVYDCDSRVKEIYGLCPELKAMASPEIFNNPEKLQALEDALFPVLKEDFEKWTAGKKWVVMESATILDKSYFEGFGDYVIWVEAPEQTRLERALGRGTVSRESILERMRLQANHKDDPRVDFVIDSSGSMTDVEKQVDKLIQRIKNMEKTDLSKILAVSGYPGLYRYVAQSRTGAIAEGLADGKRVNFPANGKITTLEDISIYADDDEVKLRVVFGKMKEALAGAAAPSAKDADASIKALFEKALPGYDRDRFHLSHMKKVVSWYNALLEYASLDFVDPEEAEK